MNPINYDCSFDGNDLTTVSGLTILASNPYEPAVRTLSLNNIARTNTDKMNSAFYTKKKIAVSVGITRATRDLLEVSLDSLLALIQGHEKTLLLRQANSTRSYTATYSDMVVKASGGSYLEADLIFETSDHYGYDQSDTLLLQISAFTSGTTTRQIAVGGSAQWQVPVQTLTLTAVGTAASSYISIGNDATGQTCVITRVWTAGDVLTIDALNQFVKVNGTEVAFTGAIPEWTPGTGYLTYADNFPSRTFSLTVNYKKRYV